jgi:hypothetical protein
MDGYTQSGRGEEQGREDTSGEKKVAANRRHFRTEESSRKQKTLQERRK